jgi:formate dehydrogenase subunit gamma
VFSQASHNSRTSIRQTGEDEGSAVEARTAELIGDLQTDAAEMLKGLHRIQHEFGYIPEDSVAVLAQRFRTSPAIVFGTIDFYSELRTQPPAENLVEWCSGPACLFKNSSGIRRALEAELGCQMNQASPDGQFELRLVQCDGTCELAPQLRYRGTYMGPMTATSAIEFARSLKPPEAPIEEPQSEGEVEVSVEPAPTSGEEPQSE